MHGQGGQVPCQERARRASKTDSCRRRKAVPARLSLHRSPFPMLYNVVGDDVDDDTDERSETTVSTSSSSRGSERIKEGSGGGPVREGWKSEQVASRMATCRLASMRISSAYLNAQ